MQLRPSIVAVGLTSASAKSYCVSHEYVAAQSLKMNALIWVFILVLEFSMNLATQYLSVSIKFLLSKGCMGLARFLLLFQDYQKNLAGSLET
jgi:hypothetical protein